MVTEGAAAFLRRYAPFDGVPEAELARAEGAIEERAYAPGELVLVEDGTPARHLYVVRSGSVELVHEEEVIDVLEPGESFGHPSLLSGMAPAFDVRAREQTVCLLIEADVALRLLGSPSGVEFVASSLRERLVRTGHVAHAQAEQRTAHLGALVHRPAVECTADAEAGDAARLMAEADVSCVLVRLGDGRFGIVTDSDLRAKLLARGRPPSTPVADLMTAPALTFPPERMAVDAMLDMLDLGIHHAPVVAADGTPVGIVTATDLMYLESRTPFALRRSITHAASVDEVVEAASYLPQMIVALIHAGVVATDLGRVLALQSDTATVRLLDLAFERRGAAPSAWAWMALGSTARREATLASDQDNALAYAEDDEDDHYAAVAADVNEGLARCGFGADNAEVLARNRQWRMSEADWRRVFRDCLEQPDRSHLVRAAVAFDFRHVCGGLQIVRPLVEIERRAPAHPDFVRRLARTATDWEPPLGFRGKLQLDDDGRIDLKRGGVVPIANLARFHALRSGVTVSGTVDRLRAAAQAGAIEPERAAALEEGFELVTRLRFEHQAAEVEAGLEPTNRIAPSDLAPLARGQLRSALREVADAQRALARFVPIGM
ncbi:MAG TPA: putative nucleotidyltransferase substrate binding domain-containing protein [Gaiellales bacterium]|jgi:CBS domain-containing protein|nr:putative nucleotidyltransferase substrate binding domain-containing protein [Gaiellales bacterium]